MQLFEGWLIPLYFIREKREKKIPSSFSLTGIYVLLLLLDQKLQYISHITQEQRYTISQMLLQGKSQKEISQTIGKDKSVVSRELKRNSDGRSGRYCYELASRKCAKRHKEKHKHRRFSPEVQSSVESLIREDYSPEQVVGSLRKQNLPCVSVERIYEHIWSDKRKGGNLYKHLRRQGRRHQKRGSLTQGRGLIANRVSIEQRSKVVENSAFYYFI